MIIFDIFLKSIAPESCVYNESNLSFHLPGVGMERLAWMDEVNKPKYQNPSCSKTQNVKCSNLQTDHLKK